MVNYGFRIPDELYEKIKMVAKREGRSINKQVIQYIKQMVAEETIISPKTAAGGEKGESKGAESA